MIRPYGLSAWKSAFIHVHRRLQEGSRLLVVGSPWLRVRQIGSRLPVAGDWLLVFAWFAVPWAQDGAWYAPYCFSL